MNKRKQHKKEEAKKRAAEFAKLPRKGQCPRCKKPMINKNRWCEKCKEIQRSKKKANKRGKSKDTYLNQDS